MDYLKNFNLLRTKDPFKVTFFMNQKSPKALFFKEIFKGFLKVFFQGFIGFLKIFSQGFTVPYPKVL